MKKLFEDYSYKIVSAEEFSPFFFENRAKVFKDHFSFNLANTFTEKQIELEKETSNPNAYSLKILIYKKEEIIGWHFGFQKFDSYYMTNTAIFEAHRNKGIYSCLLKEIIGILIEAGFPKITSSHLASNNAVIVPKLKAGFLVSGISIDERFGTMLNLSYFINPKMKKAYLMRTGEQKLGNL
ncbi:MAG: GNAT family N-acetyltransferase [Chitinophagales bacterium]